MSLKPFDTQDLRDPEPSSEQFASGATGINHYESLEPAASKLKPKNTRRRHVMALTVSVVAVVAVAVLALVLFHNFNQSSDTVADGTAVTVTIPSGAGDGDIAQRLQDAGVISSTTEFMSAISAANADGKLHSGTYQMTTGMTASAALDEILKGPDGVSLTIPEGYTVAQTAARVQDVLGIPQDTFLSQAKASNYVTDFPFLSGAYDDSLEGFLFPETYEFGSDATADTVIRAMLNEYASVTSTLDFTKATQGGTSLTEYQVVVMASMIEKESAVSSERPTIASVMFNRLNAGTYLQIDATIAYALGKYDLLTEQDLTVDSPYNTYTNLGLPPGPICSPSLDSINAVLNAAQTNYYYYVASSALDGTHVFCETDADFEVAREAYNEAIYTQQTAADTGTQTDVPAETDQTAADAVTAQQG
ncbi:MAG: endolytic transglycosylase MltG [Coriobacteriales bacterium]|jgi:UPF0755 protein